MNSDLEKLCQDIFVKQNQILAKLNRIAENGAAENGASGSGISENGRSGSGISENGRSGSGISDDAEMIDVRGERLFYRNFPSCSADLADFKEQYLRLIEGLDEKSIETVTRAINRIHAIQSCEDPYMDLYTCAEKEELRRIREHLNHDRIQLSDDCFCYRGHLLPENVFEPCVFYDLCGAGHIENRAYFADKDIIDAGAYIGDSALVLSRFTTGKVHAFEPTGKNYEKMRRTIALNGLEERIIPYRLGLSEKKGVVTFTNSIVGTTNSMLGDNVLPYSSVEEAEVTTIDDFVRESGIRVGLIKVDVEGAEQFLLRGAVRTIRDMKPTLLVSIYHNADDFYHIKPMLESLGVSYRFQIRHPAFGSILTETMLIAEYDPES